MIYTATVTSVKDTASTSPDKTVLQVSRGLIYKIDVYFPPGSAGLMGVKIMDSIYQMYPSTPGTWFVGDNNTISFDDVYLKESGPYVFDIYHYNTDDTNSHSVIIRIGMLTKTRYMARFLPDLSFTAMKDYFAGIAAEQELIQQAAVDELLENPFGELIL